MTSVDHPQKKKRDVTISMSQYLKKKLDNIVETKDFSSVSDLASTALLEFVTRHELGQENKTMYDILMQIVQTPEGRALVNKLYLAQTIDALDKSKQCSENKKCPSEGDVNNNYYTE